MMVIGLLLQSCNDVEKRTLHAALQGDWVGDGVDEVMLIQQDEIVEHQPWLVKSFEPFNIRDNEIVIDSIRWKKRKEIKKYKFDVRYSIESLVKDTLILNRYTVGDTSNKKKLRLVRLKRHYQYDFKRLSISSSPCLGGCPVFQVEITSDGSVAFQRNYSAEGMKNYVGNLKDTAMQLIRSQVDKVHWDSLEQNYYASISDTQYFNIEMETMDSKKYVLSTNSPESKSINILIFRTFKIVEQSELARVDEQLEFSTDVKDDQRR